MDNIAQIQKEIQALIERIQGEGAKLNTDEKVDLSGVDASVKDVCERIKKLPAKDHGKFKDPMTLLLDEANQLTQNLMNKRDQLGRELGGMSAHGKASQAYGRKTDSSS